MRTVNSLNQHLPLKSCFCGGFLNTYYTLPARVTQLYDCSVHSKNWRSWAALAQGLHSLFHYIDDSFSNKLQRCPQLGQKHPREELFTRQGGFRSLGEKVPLSQDQERQQASSALQQNLPPY